MSPPCQIADTGNPVFGGTIGQILSNTLIADFHNGRGGDRPMGAQRMGVFIPRGSLHTSVLFFLSSGLCYPFQSVWFLPWVTHIIEGEGGDCLCQVDEAELHSRLALVTVTWDCGHSSAGSYTMKLKGLSMVLHSILCNLSPLSLNSEIDFWTKRHKRHTNSIFSLTLHQPEPPLSLSSMSK